jgi:hypothetical protein
MVTVLKHTPTETDMTKKFEARSGKFTVWHIGKLAFTVENDAGETLRKFANLSQACDFARWLHQTNAAFL